MRSGYRTVVTWPQRGEGERAAYNLARLQASLAGGGRSGRRREPAALRRTSTCATASSPPGLKLAVLPEHRLFRRRAPERTAAATRPRAAAARCARSPTCAPATSSSTRTTASRASPASRRRPSPASRATTSTSSTRATTASSCPSTSSRRSAATSAPAARTRRCPSSAARPGTRMKARARRAAQELAGELLNLYAERRRRTRPRLSRRHRLAARVRGRLPLPRDRRPARGDRARQGRHGVRAPDGPPRSAATSASARPRSRCAPRSRPPTTASRCSMLVPTTILAQQHFGTFSERLKDYPFTIEHVSRFRSAAGAEGGDRGLSDAAPSTSSSARTACSRRDVRAQGPRPDHRRRGAALRRQAEGAAAPAQAARRRASR